MTVGTAGNDCTISHIDSGSQNIVFDDTVVMDAGMDMGSGQTLDCTPGSLSIPTIATGATPTVSGNIVFDTSTDKLWCNNGTSWVGVTLT